MTIAFAHGGLGQFEPLHRFLNESGWADSYLFYTDGNYRLHCERLPKMSVRYSIDRVAAEFLALCERLVPR